MLFSTWFCAAQYAMLLIKVILLAPKANYFVAYINLAGNNDSKHLVLVFFSSLQTLLIYNVGSFRSTVCSLLTNGLHSVLFLFLSILKTSRVGLYGVQTFFLSIFFRCSFSPIKCWSYEQFQKDWDLDIERWIYVLILWAKSRMNSVLLIFCVCSNNTSATDVTRSVWTDKD